MKKNGFFDIPLHIGEITGAAKKMQTARSILEALKEWFEVTESREKYIAESAEQHMLAATLGGKPLGFLCLKETGRDTVEIAVMGVLPEYHRQGIGNFLMLNARGLAVNLGYSFMQVKTVKMGVYEDYDATNRFYLACGFKEFEVFPSLWDAANPCQVYVMALRYT